MKKVLFPAVAALAVLLSSCVDTIYSDAFGSDRVQLEVTLNMPGASASATRAVATRVAGENIFDDGVSSRTALQYYIGKNDVYILMFKEVDKEDPGKDILYAVPSVTVSGNNGDDQRTISGSLTKEAAEMTLKADIFINLAQNGCFGTSSVSDVRSKLLDLCALEKTRAEVYEEIGTFSYPEPSEGNPYGVWTLSEEDAGRYLPMWGTTTETLTPGEDSAYPANTWVANANLYRSVAKMGVMADRECDTFELREVYVYYINEKGTFVSSETPNSKVNVQYEEPDVPDGITQRDIGHPLYYNTTDEKNSNVLLDKIYVTEADNESATGGENDEPVVIVVGGIYKGGDYKGEGLVESTEDDEKLNYYRIDLKDDADGTGVYKPFNLIRNHSYLFNILSANSPGTSDPDPRRATDGLEVEILDYTDISLSGIISQYTLTVDQSLFDFTGATTDVGHLHVTTDGVTNWELITDWDADDGYTDSEGNPLEPADWIIVTDVSEENGGHTNIGDEVTVEVASNVNTAEGRSGVFIIRAGRVVKVIHVVQNHTETANSYIITSEGDYDLNVTVRGNGNDMAYDGIRSETTPTIDISLDFSPEIDVEDIAYIGIIWETADGFVRLIDADGNEQTLVDMATTPLSASGSIAYRAHNIALDEFGNWKGNVFDKGNGANALIGAYDENKKLLWSWHIWAVGDYADGIKTETWELAERNSDGNGVIEGSKVEYTFLDRNLGAYSNMPGSASFGLLYQWGRKDPFIGAYREENERDYHKVPKQYTRMYENPGGGDWEWGDIADSEITSEGTLAMTTIQNPTLILQSGMLSSDHTGSEAEGLWGTTSPDYVAAEGGEKTMWDPSPVGFRVPSLNAFTIWDGANDLWACSEIGTGGGGTGGGGTGGGGIGGGGTGGPGGNSKRYASTQRRGRTTSSTHYEVEHVNKTLRFVPIIEGGNFRTGSDYPGEFVSNAPFYGFWLDYTGNLSGDFATGYDSGTYDVGYFDQTAANGGTGFGYINGYTTGSKPDWATWIPLAGIYNGSMDHFARAGLTDGGGPDNDLFLPASSLQVTSVLWANSPTTTVENFPAGLLLHGTEGAYTPHYGTVTFEYSSGTQGTPATLATEGMGYWSAVEVVDNMSDDCSIWWEGNSETGSWQYKPPYSEDNIVWSDENGMTGSGRHFHSLADPSESTLANPSYAASVRPIGDIDMDVYEDETVYYYQSDIDAAATEYKEGTPLTLYNYGAGSSEEETTDDEISLIVAFQEEWEVTDPGAKWLSVSPSSGNTKSGTGERTVITIKVNHSTNVQLPTEEAESVIVIHFLATSKDVRITVKYEPDETRPASSKRMR